MIGCVVMKTNFVYDSKRYVISKISLILGIMLAVSVLYFSIDKIAAIILVTAAVLLIASSFFIMALMGEITADEDRLTVSESIGGHKLYSYIIRIDKIKCAEYNVKSVNARGYAVYFQKLKIKMKKGIGYSFSFPFRSADGKPFDTNSDEYKACVDKQPLTVLCKYINERARML